MKKRIALVLFAALLLSALAGCGSSTETSSPQSSTASSGSGTSSPSAFEEGQTVDVMEFVTGPANGGWAQIGAAMEGSDPYAEKVDILRGIASLDSTLLYLVCDASVEENTVGELIENGTTVSIGTLPAGNAADMLMDLVFQEYGVTAEEISGGSVYVADGSALFRPPLRPGHLEPRPAQRQPDRDYVRPGLQNPGH